MFNTIFVTFKKYYDYRDFSHLLIKHARDLHININWQIYVRFGSAWNTLFAVAVASLSRDAFVLEYKYDIYFN